LLERASSSFYDGRTFLKEENKSMALKIIVDSSIGLTKEEALQKGYFFVPLQITLGEKTYTEGVDITPDEFYALLSQGLMPHTSQPSPELYRSAFNEATKNGDEALLLSLSSKISGAFQAANIGKNDSDHPEKVHLFDTLSFFAGSQILLQEAEAHQELPIEDLLAYLEDLKTRIHVFAGMDTLTYVYKGGRLSKFHYALGIFLHAKAIGTLDEGTVVLAGKAMGTKNAMAFVMDKTREYPIDFSYPAYLFYSSDKAILERFENEDFFPAYPEGKDWPVLQINPLIGSHIGPLVYGLFYVAKPSVSAPKPSLFEKIHNDIHAVFHKKS
jgi:DegV family protein with EDD domain